MKRLTWSRRRRILSVMALVVAFASGTAALACNVQYFLRQFDMAIAGALRFRNHALNQASIAAHAARCAAVSQVSRCGNCAWCDFGRIPIDVFFL